MCDVGYLCANFDLSTPRWRKAPDLGPMYATDRLQSVVRQTDVRQKHRLMRSPIRGGGITSCARGDTICLRPPSGRCGSDAAVQLQPIPYAYSAQRALLPIAVGSMNINELMNINDVRESATIFPRPCKLTFDLFALKVVSESRVTWATCLPILVFLGLSVLELFPMYATDICQTDVRRQIDVRQKHCLMPPPRGQGITRCIAKDEADTM